MDQTVLVPIIDNARKYKGSGEILPAHECGKHVALTLTWSGKQYRGEGIDYFDALQRLREEIRRVDDHDIFVYGSCKGLHVSGMARDMGAGLKAYWTERSGFWSKRVLVDILDIPAKGCALSIPELRNRCGGAQRIE